MLYLATAISNPQPNKFGPVIIAPTRFACTRSLSPYQCPLTSYSPPLSPPPNTRMAFLHPGKQLPIPYISLISSSNPMLISRCSTAEKCQMRDTYSLTFSYALPCSPLRSLPHSPHNYASQSRNANSPYKLAIKQIKIIITI